MSKSANPHLARAGRQIFAARKRLGMNRAELARAAGVSKSSVTRLERGVDVRASTYLAILDYLRRRQALEQVGDRITLLSEIGQARVLDLIRRFEGAS
jgi:predicted transcriptional regulator